MEKSKLQSRKGFTLIELIIVIGLLVTIAAIGGLNLHTYTLNRNLKSAARDIVADFAACRQKAVSENTTYQIVFNVAGGSYTIQTLTGVPPAVTKSVTSFGKDIKIVSAAFGATSSLTVNFDSRGTVSTPSGLLNAGGDTIILQNSRGTTATITVNTMGRTYVK
jgi:prepilin-type N-terminal cleavage/methylation domain-containing protein